MEKFSVPGPILKREKIQEQLSYIFDYPLTLVVAAMGYGKTIAVRDFLDGIKAEYVWVGVESDETSASIVWDTFARHITENEPAIGNRLNSLGVPLSAADRNRVFDLLEEWTYQASKILVLDDYHFVDSPQLVLCQH